MPDAPEQRENHDELIDGLLALPDADGKAELLRQHDLLNPEGLDALLDRADDLLNRDPGKAGKLAELCMKLAGTASALAAIPKANYVMAGACDLNGDFERALKLTELAHDGYTELGMKLEALRTDVGKMSELLDLGRYQEMLQLGQSVHTAIKNADVSSNAAEYSLSLTKALAHMNEGICYEYGGNYEEALKSFRESERLFGTLGLHERLSEASSNRAILLLNLGRSNEALSVFESAARAFSRTGQTLLHAGALMNMGYTHVQLGNFARSLKCFENARMEMGSPNVPSHSLIDENRLLLGIAYAYASLNLYSEALAAYKEARLLLKDKGTSHDRALAEWGVGTASLAKGEFEEADHSLIKASILFKKAGNVPLLSSVMLARSALPSTTRESESDTRFDLASRALSLVSARDEWPLQRFYSHLRVAELLLPDTLAAEAHMQEARRLLESMPLPHLKYRFDECMGRIFQLQGKTREAAVLYENAIGRIESLRGAVTLDSMRSSFMKDKSSIYERLLELTLDLSDDGGTDGAMRSFDVAERAKSRALADLMNGITSAAFAPEENSELGSKLAVLQSDLSAVYNRLLDKGTGPGAEGSPPRNLQFRATELEDEVNRLKLRINALVSEPPDPFEAPVIQTSVSNTLSADLIMIEHHVLNDEILAFVVFNGGVAIERGVGSVSKVRKLLRKLDSQWDRFRSGQTCSERQMAMMEKSTQRVLASLYDEVIRPIELPLEEAVKMRSLDNGNVPKLAVVPHGPLHQAPYHAFFDGENYLLERFEISYAPSARVYALCQKRKRRPLHRTVTVGVSDDAIPMARDEAMKVARLFPNSKVLLGAQATPEALEEVVARCGVLHMACHGMLRSDNPMFSALKLHEGWLLAHDAMGLNLDGAVVTLSACESGRNVVVGGDEILGLTRAFLGAGAATLLVSLWVVHDDTTPNLMRHFYERLLSGDPPATALRAAQLQTKQIHAHPYYWAPFITVGKR